MAVALLAPHLSRALAFMETICLPFLSRRCWSWPLFSFLYAHFSLGCLSFPGRDKTDRNYYYLFKNCTMQIEKLSTLYFFMISFSFAFFFDLQRIWHICAVNISCSFPLSAPAVELISFPQLSQTPSLPKKFQLNQELNLFRTESFVHSFSKFSLSTYSKPVF